MTPPAPIRVLDESLARLVRAGEVVPSPARALRELAENALDAGARRVEVTLSPDGGRERLCVRDDGGGMAREDLLILGTPHATSKTSGESDILRPATLGFRGEALAAIARVARVQVSSRRVGGEGWRRDLGSSETVPCGMPAGTEVVAEGMFEAVPARRGPDDTPARALRAARETLEALSLRAPSVAFLAFVEGRRETLLSLPPEGFAARLARVWPAAEGGVAVCGGVARGVLVASPRGGHGPWLVDGRPVRRDAAVSEALRRLETATRRRWSWGGAVDLRAADHNAHPAKEEVRHADVSASATLIANEFRAALDVRASAEGPAPVGVRAGAVAARALTGTGAYGRAVAVVGDAFVVAADGTGGLVLVDAHAAAESLAFLRLLAARDPAAPLERPLVFPVARHASAACAEALSRAGFAAEDMGDGHVSVTARPAAAAGMTPGDMAAAVASAAAGADALRPVLAGVACRSVHRKGRGLGLEQAEALLRDMDVTPGSHACPHGRPTARRLGPDALGALFGR